MSQCGRKRRSKGAPAIALALAVALSGSGCAGVREAMSSAPEGVPSGREGWMRYTVGQLRFEAPAEWSRSGAERRLRLERADGLARLEVSTPAAAFAGQAACLEDASKVMKRGEGMQRARSHPTTFAGMRALSLEGDQNGWHVWAWAACDGGVQYQIFLTARSPSPPDVVDLYRALVGGARVGGAV
jgi:hypothetical protein